MSPIKSIPFLKFSQDYLRSTLGITCGRGSFAVYFGDHLRSRDQLRLGIIIFCGTVQYFWTLLAWVWFTYLTFISFFEQRFPHRFSELTCYSHSSLTNRSLSLVTRSYITMCTQRAKKVVSDSPGLVDFAIRLVNSVFNLPNGQVTFF